MENRVSSTRHWQDLSPSQRTAVSILGTIQFVLFLAAQIDLIFRPEEQVRGKKIYWRLAAFINTIGPLAYFIFGIRRNAAEELSTEVSESIALPE